MKQIYFKSLVKTIILFLIFFLLCYGLLSAQACAMAAGDQTTYGTNNVWIGYVYTGQDLNPANYQGYVNEGAASGPIFNEDFGGGGVNDGYRLSLDGGSTFPINNWNDHGYTTTSNNVSLTGMTSFVLEFYQNGGANDVSFDIVQNCTGTGDTTAPPSWKAAPCS